MNLEPHKLELSTVYDGPPTYKDLLLAIDALVTFIGKQNATIAKQKNTIDHDTMLKTMMSKEAITQSIGDRISRGSSFGIFMLDMNNFGHLNKEFSQQYGDEILKSFENEISQAFKRNSDNFGYNPIESGRAGGDEFIFIVDIGDNDKRSSDTLTQMDGVENLLRQCIMRVQQGNPGCVEFGFGAAVGGAVFNNSNSVDQLTLLNQANEAMREDKEVVTVNAK